MSKKMFTYAGFVLIFIVTVLICERFSYGTLWIEYIGKSAAENFWYNMLTLAIYTVMFVIGIVFIRKGKDKKQKKRV